MARDRLGALGNDDDEWGRSPGNNRWADNHAGGGANGQYSIEMDRMNRPAGNDGRGRAHAREREDRGYDNRGYNSGRPDGRGHDNHGYDSRGYNPDSHAVNMGGNPDNEFFTVTDSITTQLADLDNLIREIKDLNSRLLMEADRSNKYQALKDGLESRNAQAKRQISVLKRDLKSLDASIKRAQSDPSVSKSQIISRSARQQELTRRLADSIQRYRSNEHDASNAQREQLKRQYRLVNPSATPEQVEDAVNDGQSDIFAKAVQSSSRRNQANAVLREVDERRKQMLEIEKSVMQLASLFEEVNDMVHQQQQMFDDIEAAIEDTEQNIDKGVDETKKGIVYAKKSRKKKWIILFIVLIIIAIIAVLIYLKVSGKI
ncbi:hypothetical protein GGI07_001096 [Coemansia sp. Benny D115]|nr:hypothetical protein GGI07_001096 [Coemansia sp. Benny D115]